MSGEQSSLSEQEHWAIQQLLARYAELLRSDQDAARMYPNVHDHLQTCAECQAILDHILAPMLNGGDTESKLDAADLSFMQDADPDSTIAVSPLSDAEAFRVHIALSLEHPPAERMRDRQDPPPYGFDALSTGGRLLLFDVIALGDEEVEVMLTLHQDADTATQRIVGRIFGETLPEHVRAQLYINDETFFTEARDGELVFAPITIPEDVSHISLTLESVHPA